MAQLIKKWNLNRSVDSTVATLTITMVIIGQVAGARIFG